MRENSPAGVPGVPPGLPKVPQSMGDIQGVWNPRFLKCNYINLLLHMKKSELKGGDSNKIKRKADVGDPPRSLVNRFKRVSMIHKED